MLSVLYRLPRGAALPDGVFSIGFISIKAASFGSSWHAESSRIRYEFRVQGGQEASHPAYTARREVLSREAQNVCANGRVEHLLTNLHQLMVLYNPIVLKKIQITWQCSSTEQEETISQCVVPGILAGNKQCRNLAKSHGTFILEILQFLNIFLLLLCCGAAFSQSEGASGCSLLSCCKWYALLSAQHDPVPISAVRTETAKLCKSADSCLVGTFLPGKDVRMQKKFTREFFGAGNNSSSPSS